MYPFSFFCGSRKAIASGGRRVPKVGLFEGAKENELDTPRSVSLPFGKQSDSSQVPNVGFQKGVLGENDSSSLQGSSLDSSRVIL